MLEAQDARFRTGQLSPERQGARVLAQCQLRRFELGLAGLEAFERANPGSSLLPRLRAACGAKAP